MTGVRLGISSMLAMRPFSTAAAFLIGAVVATGAPAAAAPEQPVPCPAAATAQLDGFYRWFLASGDQVRSDFASQKSRFTPSLFKTLRAAFSLQPQDGRFVDFDPFSNTQVSSYGHRVAGCRRDSGGSLVMRVEVLAGLRRSGAQVQNLDYVLKPHDKSWRIADIVYGGESSFRLSDYLRTLLEQP